MRRVGTVAGVVVAAMAAVLVYGTVRNNRALLDRVVLAVILIAIAAAIVRWTWSRGAVTRLVGGMMGLLIVMSAVGASCTGTVGDPVRYAALGDSYSSGEGAKASGHPYDDHLTYGPGATDARDEPKCHRSLTAYPGLLRKHLGQTTLLFTACSGATIDQVAEARQYPRTPPQLDTLRAFAAEGPVDLVTISVGGNDLGFASVMTTCSTKKACASGDPYGIKAKLLADLDELPKRLAQTYRQIRKVVGEQVPVLVVGYPKFLPDERGCLATPGLDAEERAFLNGSVELANRAVRSASVLSGTYYVDVQAAFDGHRVCSADPYAHGVVTPGADTVAQGDFLTGAYHPTSGGQLCLAYQLLQQYPEPTSLAPPPIGEPMVDQIEPGWASPCP